MDRLFISLILIVAGVCCGYIFQQLVNRDIIQLTFGLPSLQKKIQQIIFVALNPLAIVGATWVAKLDDLELIILPFLCLTALGLGGILAYALSRVFSMDNRQTGAYIGSGTFTNIGALGALFCYMFLGEAGFALVPIYKLFEEFTYFAYVFPLVKSFSPSVTQDKTSFLKRLQLVFRDIFVIMTLTSIGLGLLLNLTEVTRPMYYASLNSVLIPVIVFMLLFSIGLGMRFSSIMTNIRPALAISAVKALLIPATIAAIGIAFGLHTINEGIPFKVVLILSAMPVGLLSVVPPTLYDLDSDLANSCWLVSSSFLIIEIPLLLYIISHLPF
ncbi:AEC family transporter [Desulforhopalus sp. 52FAK]